MAKAVTVGCKLPMGIVCELGTFGSPDYKKVILNGSNSARIAGGYGLTTVDDTFMKAWLEKYSWMEAVQKGFIFVQSSETEAMAQALSNPAGKSGFEPLSPSETPDGIVADEAHLAATKRDNIKQLRGDGIRHIAPGINPNLDMTAGR